MVLLAACSEDHPHSNDAVSISVLCSPMTNGRSTRAGVWDDVPTPDYPEQICVVPSTGIPYIIEKSGDNDNGGYIAYHVAAGGPTDLQMEGKTFKAYAPELWTEVPEISPCDYLSGDGSYNWNKAHLFFELKHATALLRFRFKVDEKYDRSRQVLLKNFKLNAIDITVKDGGALMGTTLACKAVCYVNPTFINQGGTLNLSCTYDVYDKDGIGTEHLVRGNEIATNSLTIGKAGSTIESIQVGKYYDFNITINPDSLHVMSDHDNKYLIIE